MLNQTDITGIGGHGPGGLAVAVVVFPRLGQRQQMHDAPADDEIAALQIPVMAPGYSQHPGIRLPGGGLFSNDKFHSLNLLA